ARLLPPGRTRTRLLPPGRPRTRWLRYRGSGSARSGDSEPPTRERPPDPTLNPACPRTTTCGSYLARDPARVAPLRVAFYMPKRNRVVEAGYGRQGAAQRVCVLREFRSRSK